nr:hypothetical protein [Tanacetum cinerariifolium]
MEEYMKKTREPYGSGLARAKFDKDAKFELKGKTVEEAYYTQFVVPFLNAGMYRAAAPGLYQRDNGNLSYHERRQMMEESLSKFMVEYAKRHDEHSSLIKEIRASTDVAIRIQGASIKALEIQCNAPLRKEDVMS